MSFLDNIISKNNSGDDFVKYKDIVLNLDVCLLMLKNGDIEYINPAGEALISRINGCSKEDYDCEICEKQINLLLEQGIGALSNSMRQRYSYITAINGQRTVFYIKIEIYKLQMDETRMMVRFEDYTDQYLAEEYMKSVNKTNSMISKISSRFLGNYDKDKAVNEALRDVGMLTGADRVYVFELLKENTIIDNTYEWCNKEIDSLMEKRKQLNFEDYTWWIKEINAHEKVWIMRDCKDYDCSLNDINILNLYNITSLFVFPIKSQNEIVGFIGADNISPSCEMNNEINKILTLVARLVGNSIDSFKDKEAIIESEKRFRELFHNINSAIFIHKLEDNKVNPYFLMVNEHACNILGYSQSEFSSLTLHDLIEGNIYEDIINEINDNSHKKNMTFEVNLKTKDNALILGEMTVTNTLLNNEEIVLIAIKDISNRRIYEKKLEDRNKELKDALVQLKEIQNQMIHQEKMAGIGQLAAGIAHEINNPLGYVMSNFDTLKKYIEIYDSAIEEFLKCSCNDKNLIKDNGTNSNEGASNSTLIRRLNLIKEDMPDLIHDSKHGLDRIHKIITGLRLFSRSDESDTIEDYDLNEGIESTLLVANNEIKYYANVIKKLGIISSIKVIPVEINQVLLNLIVNAVHAIKEKSPDTQGDIIITTFEEEDFVCCSIEDTGIGIKEEIVSEIFNPFFTTKPVGQGTGLGLSISYEIIKNKHKGDLIVESTPNKGSKFTIKLPK